MQAAIPFNKNSSWLRKLTLLVLLLGIALRLTVFVQNRSLFIDEANLARNVVEKDYRGFFSPLDYEQYAPPLFLLETKLMTKILGAKDFVFRLIPLISGIGLLLILFLLLREWLDNELIVTYGMALACFSVLFLKYSTEFKQYSSDALLCVLALWFASQEREKLKFSKGDLAFWIFFGTVGLWYSMPFVFVLVGVFLFLFQKIRLRQLIGVGCSWAFSGLAYYFFILSADIGDDNIQTYFAQKFVSLNLLSLEAWQNNFVLFAATMQQLLDKTVLSICFATIIFFSGIYYLWTFNRNLFKLLTAPIAAMILASVIHAYPIEPRLLLFSLPLLICIACFGLSYLWDKSHNYVKFLLGALMLLTSINKKGYEYFLKPMKFEETRMAINELAGLKTEAEQVYVHYGILPAFEYYNKLDAKPSNIKECIVGEWGSKPFELLVEKMSVNEPFWFLIGHLTEQEIDQVLRQAKTRFKIIETKKYKRARVLKMQRLK